MRAALFLLLACIAGCATTSGSAADPTAADALTRAEELLLQAPVVRVDYDVSAGGVVVADLSGDLVLQKPGMAAIAARGEFVGAPAQLQLVADGDTIRGGNSGEQFNQPLPAGLHEGLVLGLVRMGILHNLAMLSSGAPPDATDGSAQEFARAERVRWESTPTGPEAALLFDLFVHGELAGEVTLWIDTATGLPTRREQLVRFDQGEMNVSENYRIELDGMVGPCRFKVAETK